MKDTGIVRKVDELGRIVIPMEIREDLGIEVKTPIRIYVEGQKIILRKNLEACLFCDSTKNLINFEDKLICSKCITKIQKLNKSETL